MHFSLKIFVNSVCVKRHKESNTEMSPPNDIPVHDIIPEISLQANQKHQRKQQRDWEGPPAQGLYDPQNEHEACGVGFIVAIDGKRSHKVLIFSACFFYSLLLSIILFFSLYHSVRQINSTNRYYVMHKSYRLVWITVVHAHVIMIQVTVREFWRQFRMSFIRKNGKSVLYQIL